MKAIKGQFWHFTLLTILLSILYYVIQKDIDILNGSLWGISTETWLVLAVLSPIIHQIYVLVMWRLELHYKTISRISPKHGFKIFKAFFAFLILSRPVTIVLLAISSQDTIEIPPFIAHPLSFIFALLGIYLFYSVKKYFGMDRAFGIDHFQAEKIKDLPFVKEGIFKYSSNSMYVFGFLILWIPGLFFLSKAALVVALFNHLYIWVHFYFTEKPDMKFIYGGEKKN